MISFSSELRRLLSCLRAALGVKPDDNATPLEEPADWSAFLGLVDRHRVAPVLHEAVLPAWSAERLPPSVRQALHARAARNALRATRLTEELARLVEGFVAEGIPVLAFKGPTLAVLAYGNPARRHAGDLDLLIAPEDCGRALDLLNRNGYACSGNESRLSARQQEAIRRTVADIALHPITGYPHLELHLRLTSNPHLLPLDTEGCIGRAQTVEIAGQEIRTLSHEDLLFYLCAHGAQHQWYRLFWLVDVAKLCLGEEAADWARRMARAKELGTVRTLAQGVELTGRLLGVSVPVEVRSYTDRDPTVEYLVRQSCRAIEQAEEYRPNHLMWAHRTLGYGLRLQPGLRFKLQEIRWLLVHPVDYETVRLPDLLFPLYYGLRPLLWIHRRWRRR